jgi:gliding motility-associated lipoprotein GldD
MKKLAIYSLVFFAISACGDSEILIPKPPTYLRLDLPEHTYKKYQSNCGYSFESASVFKIKEVVDSLGNVMCHRDIELGPLNGVIHFSFIDMKEPLSVYVNFANDKVDEHKLKATAIEDVAILHPENKVYGTFFELQGDVASPFQFYLTDSTSHFVSGVVYFNSTPNYDSLKPTLDYLKVDLLQMVNTFKWK